MNLNEALTEFQKCEDAEIEIPDDLSQFVKEKIDAYQMVASRMAADIMRYKEQAEHFQKKMQSRANELERLKSFISNAMEYHGWQQLKGQQYTVKLVKQQRFSPLVKPDAEIMAKFPELVECQVSQTYKWNQSQLKGSFEENPELLKEYAGYKEIKFIRFD